MTEPRKHELIEVLGKRSLMNTAEFWEVLKGAVVPVQFSDEQTMVFLSVAHSLNLNPLNGEVSPAIIDGRVAALVTIDGWLKRANDHPEMDGMDVSLADDGKSCTVTIYRKDRSHATVITEYLDEVRKNTGPWKSHPKRMLRHRGIIQAVRVAFGSGGAIDADDRDYFPADGTVVEPEDLTDRMGELNTAIGEAVGEPEPAKFAMVDKTSCNWEGCRKRLVRFCEKCGFHFCVEHYDINSDECMNCFAEVEPEKAPEQPKEDEGTKGQEKYPQAQGADPMPGRGKEEELPWD